MPDQKPPRVSAGERETLQALLQYQRDSLVRKITGADEAAARQPAVGSGTTLLWLVKHMTRAEILWAAVRFAGQDVPVPDDAVHGAARGTRRHPPRAHRRNHRPLTPDHEALPSQARTLPKRGGG